jgi:hypothetical protein
MLWSTEKCLYLPEIEPQPSGLSVTVPTGYSSFWDWDGDMINLVNGWSCGWRFAIWMASSLMMLDVC